MAKKFMVFANADLEPIIVLDNVMFHNHIQAPDGYKLRAGGGYWDIDKNGTLHLSDESVDFGKYNKKLAKKAFDNKQITLAEEMSFDDLKIKNIDIQ